MVNWRLPMTTHASTTASVPACQRRFPAPSACRRRNNVGERLGRLIARIGHPCGLRYRLFRRQTQVAFPEIDVRIPQLPLALDGFRITQISDLHYSVLVVEDDYDLLFERIAQCQPHLFVLTGDNVSYHAECIEPIVRKLGQLRAPCGVLAILGNHDYWEGAEVTAQCYAEQGIRLLVNEWVPILHNGAMLVIAGLDDHCEGQPDLDTTLAGVPEHAPVILLSHIPVVAQDPRTARAGLILSGHVHGGQVRLPLYGPISMPECSPRQFVQGYYRTPYSQLYVSCGVGASVLWFRWHAQPEVPTFVLRAEPSGSSEGRW